MRMSGGGGYGMDVVDDLLILSQMSVRVFFNIFIGVRDAMPCPREAFAALVSYRGEGTME